MPRWPYREDVEPRERVGICCGERCARSKKRHGRDVALYRVRQSRYRCRECFKLEVGYWP